MTLRGIGIIRIGCFVALMVQFVPSAFAQQGSKFVSYADINVGASLTQIRPANSARVVLTCSNTDSSNGLRVGDELVSATRGVRVPPGGVFMVTATPIVYGFSEGGTVAVACSEEIR